MANPSGDVLEVNESHQILKTYYLKKELMIFSIFPRIQRARKNIIPTFIKIKK